ncbi:hypothetical protein [Acidisoma sp. 7E03]
MEHFAVTRGDLIHVVQMAVGARRDSTDDDPATAPGTLSYIFGTRHIRILFRAKKWKRIRENGIEAVFDEKSGKRIVFQNVDLAADLQYNPKAISKKKVASKELIETAQGNLFAQASSVISAKQERGEVWYLCVSCDEITGVRAELSRPVPLENDQFVDFHERIIFLKKGEFESVTLENDLDMPNNDYDIRISRK